jgi:hypothetical protein
MPVSLRTKRVVAPWIHGFNLVVSIGTMAWFHGTIWPFVSPLILLVSYSLGIAIGYSYAFLTGFPFRPLVCRDCSLCQHPVPAHLASGPFILWPVVAIENAARALERSAHVCDAVHRALSGLDLDDLADVERVLGGASVSPYRRVELTELVHQTGLALVGIEEALASLTPGLHHEEESDG